MLGAFLQTLAEWARYCTLTYSGELSSTAQVERDVRRWADRIAARSGDHVTLAVAVEAQTRGVLHAHVLLAFGERGESVHNSDLGLLWRHGFSKIEFFDRELGAAWYLAEAAEWGVVKGCPRRPRCRRRSGCAHRAQEVPVLML